MHKKHIAMLAETMNIFEKGHYTLDRETVPTKLSRERAKVCQVFLPEDIRQIENRQDLPRVHVMGRIGIECENMDSFEMARKLEDYRAKFMKADDRKVLVLNFANPTNPGGGVRVGASAQEEDLCRKSSLLLSLESKEARRYYEYNRSLYSRMGSDAIILTPEVEIIRDSSGALLRDSILVSVMTCAAPMVTQGKEGLSEEQYRALLYQRICRMLKCAASWGYRLLVLGAFGCGAFGNDAQLVSDLFYKALKEFSYGGMTAKDFFWKIGFAVLSRWEDPYNYRAFARNFDDFYRDEDRAEAEKALAKMRATEVHLDAIRGCLLGGAVGDALGYAVEFIDADKIFQRYGRQGIREYCLDRDTGKALISDDTQMTLFTATGLLVRQTRAHMRGICGYPRMYVARAYRDWLYTQEHRFSRATQEAEPRYSWLRDVPELYVPRAPGMTCLSALRAAADRNDPISFLSVPRNSSKGCGGVMRVAPLALDRTIDRRSLDQEAAEVAAITHGHSLGYMPAAVLCHVINRIVFPGPTAQSLKEIVLEARNALPEVFPGDPHLQALIDIIDEAVTLSENSRSDLDNIRQLGEGWVAEEALAIALYCSLKYRTDLSAGIIAAVNHSGDSDSTGAITGNILGALLGYGAIEEKWKRDLECADVILEIADDLCHGCQMAEYSTYYDPAWANKYMGMRRWTPPVTE